MSYCPLDLVENYLRRFVVYPSEHALVAHALWIAHTHLIGCFDTTPRLAFMPAEKESGKTRVLEVTELFVPNPRLSFSMSAAALVRIMRLLLERSSPDRCNAAGESFWYVRVAVCRKNENARPKNLNKLAHLPSGA
jgi:hypothetical protein